MPLGYVKHVSVLPYTEDFTPVVFPYLKKAIWFGSSFFGVFFLIPEPSSVLFAKIKPRILL